MTLEQERKIGLIEMKQTLLIQLVVEAIGLDNGMVKGEFTPSDQRPLVKDTNGEPPSELFSYISVVVMIIYL